MEIKKCSAFIFFVLWINSFSKRMGFFVIAPNTNNNKGKTSLSGNGGTRLRQMSLSNQHSHTHQHPTEAGGSSSNNSHQGNSSRINPSPIHLPPLLLPRSLAMPRISDSGRWISPSMLANKSTTTQLSSRSISSGTRMLSIQIAQIRSLTFLQQQHQQREFCSCKRREQLMSSQYQWILADIAPGVYRYNTVPMASGSQGNLHHAFSYALGKCVAIKISDFTGSGDWAYATRIEVEFLKKLASYKLDRVLNMITFQEKNQRMVLVMELGDVSLKDYWDKFKAENAHNEAILIEEAKQLTKEILEAFDQLHNRARLMHLDFKPENCMISFPEPGSTNSGRRRGVVKLIDFGASQEVGSGEYVFYTIEPKELFGTMLYYAPEQRIKNYYSFVGHNQDFVVSIKSDVWAIGSLITEFLTGYPANLIFFPNLDRAFVEDNSEYYGYVYKNMRRNFYPFVVEQWSPSKAPLFYMAMACLHADPRLRPTIRELLGYMNNEHAMPISSQYQMNINHGAAMAPKTYSDVMREAGMKTTQIITTYSLREKSMFRKG